MIVSNNDVAVEVRYVTRPSDEGLSQTAIIAIAVSSGVAGLAVVVAWIAVVACCCVLRAKRGSRARVASSPTPSEKYVSIRIYDT